MEIKMNTKQILVSFMTIASVLLLVATVSAYTTTGDLAENGTIVIQVDNVNVDDFPAIIAGETVSVWVRFTADVEATDVRIKAEIEGDKVDVDERTASFDVEEGQRYSKVLKLEVPYELKDEVSENVSLNIKIWDGNDKTEVKDIELRVQRPSYNVDVKSITVSNEVDAGETFPVDIVIMNRGYNDLDDLYVRASISALGVDKVAYFGDLVALEEDDDDEDTVSGKLYLEVPFDVTPGVYVLEVEVTNDDTTSTVVKQIVINNDFASNVIIASTSRTVAVGEDAEYNLLIVNPTDKVKVYRVVSESNGGLSSNVGETVVAVPAGSSKNVAVTARADAEGQYSFSVNVFSGESLSETVALSLNVEGSSITNPVVVLTIILAVIFLVLLIVLIVLIGKKPARTEEFGESYY
jgi:hypothetical protein